MNKKRGREKKTWFLFSTVNAAHSLQLSGMESIKGSPFFYYVSSFLRGEEV